MRKDDVKYSTYVQTLKEELVPAMGCTEPIALAYGAAKAREVLGCLPERVVIEASGSIIKNVKSVIVPNTDHLKGIPAAATAGIVAGKAEKELECIKRIYSEILPKMDELEEKPLSEAIYAVATEAGIEPKALFNATYQILISKDQGPRLANFMKIIGKERLEKIFKVYC